MAAMRARRAALPQNVLPRCASRLWAPRRGTVLSRDAIALGAVALGAVALILGACQRGLERPAPERVTPVQVAAPAKPAPITPGSASSERGGARGTRVDVPAGGVEIGGRRVEVAAFSIDRTEVTTQSYARCVAEGHCTPPGTGAGCNYPSRANHPINCVTAEQAERYCAHQGMRLPTLAEWQLAAGGTEGRRYPWGADHPSNLWVSEPVGDGYPPGPARHKLCWVGDGTAEGEIYPESTCPVGSYPAGNTPSGIADLAGNVAEWTRDVEKLPEGGSAHRAKGGGFSFDPMGPLPVGVTDSELYPDPHHAPDVGFRCASAASAG